MPADIATALYTAEQVREIDRRAIEQFDLPGPILMQRAASAAFDCLRRHWPDARRLLLLCGRGNNGGDAWLLGATALSEGFEVQAIGFGEPRGDALAARERFRDAGGQEVDAGSLDTLPAADVVVDGLFGIGLDRDIDAPTANLIEQLNASNQHVLSLDIPSGLCADLGVPRGFAVRATATISFVAWKRGLFTGAALDHCGELELETLDIPASARQGIAPDARLLDVNIGCLLQPRERNSNKGNYGHLLAVGSDHGFAGAIRMTADAALRCGAGKVSVATRADNVAAINAARPELMAHSVDGPQELTSRLEGVDVIALGPGLGLAAWGHALWDTALHSGLPCVIDADALNLLARESVRLAGSEIISRSSLPKPKSGMHVLTPHPGEAARLLGSSTHEIQSDRYRAARDLAARHGVVVVLKGAGTLVADPDGHVVVCPWGNPGMASGGMGDVLTGVIAALLAQGLSAWDAARLGVAIHARAGDIAAGPSPRGMIATDLFPALRELVNTFTA
ncbi:MAG: NAD(P)H-hydrate dehydratase [Dokdonella sp.]